MKNEVPASPAARKVERAYRQMNETGREILDDLVSRLEEADRNLKDSVNSGGKRGKPKRNAENQRPC